LDKVTIKVPATTANLGPGFDCLGMALNIHNTMTFEKSEAPSFVMSGEGAGSLSGDLIYRSLEALYAEADRKPPDLAISCHNGIPVASGLGSSAATIVGALVGGNMLLGEPFALDQLVQLAAQTEGHPDNTTPALLGGCQVMVQNGKKVVYASIPLPKGLKAVLFVPDFSLPTAETRQMLPQQVSMADAVHNISRTALLVTALATSNLAHLKLATQDRLHQPTRGTLFPAMTAIFEAALAVGALGVFLSGGGPTVCALTLEKEEAIADAMLASASKAGVKGRTKIAEPSLIGAQVVS